MRALKVSLLQTATHWHDPAANRALFDGLLDALPEGSQVAVLPEMFSTGFTMASVEVAERMDGPTIEWMCANARKRNVVVCGSLVVNDQGNYFNRFLWAAPDGDVAVYDKRHRFRMADEHEHYSAGTERRVIEYQGWRVCPMVCYDLRFPVWFRNRRDYDVLLCVANWPAARQLAWQTLLRARAIENQCYMLGVNVVGTDGAGVVYGGGSAAYTPDGATLAEASDQLLTLSVALQPEPLQQLRDSFPAWQDADAFDLR